MLIFVIPVFQEMYANSGSKLPAITQILINISEFLRNTEQLTRFLPILIAILFIGFRYLRTKSFKKNLDTLLLKLPLLKK